MQCDQLVEWLSRLQASGVRGVVDHCGRPDPGAGLGQPGFQALLDLGRQGRCCAKLSGYAKFSRQPFPYEDAWPFVRALVQAFTPQACVWASDWPFLRAPERIDYGVLLRLVGDLFPDRQARAALLWETPRAWFGFAGDETAVD